MKAYIRRPFYYETDQMGIVHHSNYIRWMEEARIDYVAQMGLEYGDMEKEGIIMPVISVECRYKSSAHFNEPVYIYVETEKFSGIRASFKYKMVSQDDTVVALASSGHCFLDSSTMLPVSLKRRMPEYSEKFEEFLKDQKTEVI